jgi:hypothetical protein
MIDWKDPKNHDPNHAELWLIGIVLLALGYVLFHVLRSL